MWEFDIVYIPGKKNVVADALLRRPKLEGQEPLEELEEDVEDFINAYLNAAQIIQEDNRIRLTNLLYGNCVVDVLF